MDGAVQRGLDRIDQQLQGRVSKGKLDAAEARGILSRLHAAESLEDSLAGADLFIEAVAEDLDIKRSLFARVGQAASPEALLASNTSSLSITALAAASGRPDRFIGLHFFNPAPVMRLVEVIRGDQTSEAPLQCGIDAVRQWGKTPAVASDTPGFIVNRVARNFYGESLRLLGEGATDHETIDRIMKQVGGFPMGPFELMDLVGIEVNLAVTKSVYHAFFEEPRFRPHPIQQKMVEAGLLGRKSKKGFYDYGA
jgi:3-hydroxybutyryl-CoA dehydrogenase